MLWRRLQLLRHPGINASSRLTTWAYSPLARLPACPLARLPACLLDKIPIVNPYAPCSPTSTLRDNPHAVPVRAKIGLAVGGLGIPYLTICLREPRITGLNLTCLYLGLPLELDC
jgi:hypothetical protein